MSIFGKLLKTTFDVATLPVDMAKDFMTLGGAVQDRPRTYTGDKLREIGKDLEDVSDELGKL